MKYKLSEEEIMLLYPLATPQSILNEFGSERCMTVSAIYKIYARKGLPNPRDARKSLLKEIIVYAKINSPTTPSKEIEATAIAEIERKKLRTIDYIWSMIKEYEDTYA